MKTMKRTITALLMMTMIFCSMPAAACGYSAASEEPNDVRSKAVTVQPGTFAYGSINRTGNSGYQDVDYFRTIVPADGYAVIDFVPMLADAEGKAIDEGWNVALYVNDSTDMTWYGRRIKTGTESPRISVRQGDILYAKITADNSYRMSEDIRYRIRFSMTADENWEKESNDVRSRAVTVKSGTVYRANLGVNGGIDFYNTQYKDVDYWKYEVKEEGPFCIRFKKDSIDIEEAQLGDGWDISLYTGGSTSSFYCTTVTGAAFTSPNFSFKKGTVIYIAVKAHNVYNSHAPGFIDYQLKVNQSRSTAWENENNDTAGKARKIAVGSTYYGNLSSNTERQDMWGILVNPVDQDWYRFTASRTGTARLYFGRRAVDGESGYGWDITVRINGRTVTEIREVTSLYKASRKVCSFKVKKGQKVYIRIRPHTAMLSSCPMNVDYALKVKNL